MAARVHRHSLRARLLHGLNALVMLVLLFSGLALADALPSPLVNGVGGHDAIDRVHRGLGLAFAGMAAMACAWWWRSAWWLARELTRWRSGEWSWPAAYLRHAFAPARRPVPFHAGHFDPLERLVLSLLLLAATVAAVSGVYLYLLPPAPLWVFLIAIRAHVIAAWGVLALLAIHAVAGSGLLPSHRGIASSMFGDGRLPLDTARRLWPGWTERAMRAERDEGRREAD
ncbi:MAG: cytochrome b/b6 domain-containing protein [Proteobacteria bacterium]|nr:cytochrome b/b6 domain-containing protein [Pseudomonadota bacterium]